MREKYLAAGVDAVQHAFVQAIELSRRQGDASRIRTEADGGERRGRETFEVRMLIYSPRKLLGKTDVLAQDLAQTLRTKMPKNHPKL